MKKEMSAFHLIVISCFVGILLTVSIFYLTNIFVTGEPSIAPYCYDGSGMTAQTPISAFNRAVYQSESSLNFIHQTQYRLFDTVNSNLVVAGGNNFLFDTEDKEHGYSYIEDFTGNCGFTEAEKAGILQQLQQRMERYAQQETEYLLVIIPNAQTVYSEEMPSYYGSISENTRLQQLEQYLLAHEFQNFINLTDDLLAAKEFENAPLYHNTENALNSLGLYYAYQAIFDTFSYTVQANTRFLERESLFFDQHETSGRALAKKAGLGHIIKNKTLSLSGTTPQNYRFVQSGGTAETTILLPFYVPSDISGSPELLLQFGNEQDRLQIEPYFSNSFGKVTYQIGYQDDPEIYAAATPRVVLQFIYENELTELLAHNSMHNGTQ
ncbi:MAG: hypothetical protein E7585_06160 [Ruminococcaceae bacterium]|nr:hypothetical protein [Oscillospiraceae bacterium]